jgi:hypothetical protein
LCGNEPGIKEIASSYPRIVHLAQIKKNKNNTPIISDVFTKVRQLAKHDLICYLACDIILLSDFQPAAQKLALDKPFFALGRRTDFDLQESIDFNQSNWEEKLLAKVQQKGRLHGFSAMDLMIFPKKLVFKVPDFLIGRPGWDNALIYQLIKQGIKIIDVTPAITAIHQNHNYSHHSQGKFGVWKGEEARYNFKLAGGFSKMATIRNAHLMLTPQGLTKPSLLRRIYSAIFLIYPLRRLVGFKRWWGHKRFLT